MLEQTVGVSVGVSTIYRWFRIVIIAFYFMNLQRGTYVELGYFIGNHR